MSSLLTIIVPVYNVEPYLDKCLSSLLNQTVLNHHVVIVNDGSTDSSGEIAKRYAVSHPALFQYIEQENCGLGAARNKGLQYANTPYVTFLDSDDWQDCYFVENFIKEISRHEETPDIIFTLPTIYDAVSRHSLQWYDAPLFESIFFPNKNFPLPSREVSISDRPDLLALEPNANRRIFSLNFIQKIKLQFPEGIKWEDIQPHFLALHYAKRCIGIHNTGFFYRINTANQITAGTGAGRLDMIPVFKSAFQTAEDHHFSAHEITYIARMLCNYTTWSIQVTNTEFIKPLLDQFHSLFVSIDKKHFKDYYHTCLRMRKDILLVSVLRSPFYNILSDYFYRHLFERITEKVFSIMNRFRRTK